MIRLRLALFAILATGSVSSASAAWDEYVERYAYGALTSSLYAYSDRSDAYALQAASDAASGIAYSETAFGYEYPAANYYTYSYELSAAQNAYANFGSTYDVNAGYAFYSAYYAAYAAAYSYYED